MTTTTKIDAFAPTRRIELPTMFQRQVRAATLARLRTLQLGRLVIRDREDVFEFGEGSPGQHPTARIDVTHPAFWTSIAFGGSIGAGEAWMLGYFQSPSLVDVIRVMALNRDALEKLEGGLARVLAPLNRLWHKFRDNTVQGSRDNIVAHYDLGNDFYKLWLDRSMAYSSAIFDRPDMSLDEAQEAKFDRICRKLDLRPSDHLVEIGTGWGGLAIHAASQFGCRVTTTTISPSQAAWARKAIGEAGLGDRITVVEKDYRHLEGRYDKLVSVEMIEAVGAAWFDTYFKTCSDLLKPDGQMLIQAITIEERHYDNAVKNVDFIQRYIFPGSCIPSMRAMMESVARATDLRLFHHEDFTPHYATTLRLWRERFFARLPEVRALGFDDRFIRMWEFYLAYCEGGFAERAIGVVHGLFTKPHCRRAPVQPPLR